MAFSGVSSKQIIPTFLLRAVFAPVILGLFACVAVPEKFVAVTVLSLIVTLSTVISSAVSVPVTVTPPVTVSSFLLPPNLSLHPDPAVNCAAFAVPFEPKLIVFPAFTVIPRFPESPPCFIVPLPSVFSKILKC